MPEITLNSLQILVCTTLVLIYLKCLLEFLVDGRLRERLCEGEIC